MPVCMIRNFLIKCIKFYQENISPTRPAVCRFYPSCSEYSLQAIKKHGAFKGVILTIYRLVRCNPLFKGGYDPVPEKKIKK